MAEDKSAENELTAAADAAKKAAEPLTKDDATPEGDGNQNHADPSEKVECRVLCDGPFGKINDVVTVTRDVAEANQGADLDISKSAVASAKKMAKDAAKAKKGGKGK